MTTIEERLVELTREFYQYGIGMEAAAADEAARLQIERSIDKLVADGTPREVFDAPAPRDAA